MLRKINAKKKSLKKTKTRKFSEKSHKSLNEAVTESVRRYFEELGEQHTTDFYSLVLEQIEIPLLRETMAYTHQNQSHASKILGLSRGTLRSKLRQYNLVDR